MGTYYAKQTEIEHHLHCTDWGIVFEKFEKTAALVLYSIELFSSVGLNNFN